MTTNTLLRIKSGVKKRRGGCVSRVRASLAHDVGKRSEPGESKQKQRAEERLRIQREREQSSNPERKYTPHRPPHKIISLQQTLLQNDSMQRLFCSPSGWPGCQGFEADNWRIQTKETNWGKKILTLIKQIYIFFSLFRLCVSFCFIVIFHHAFGVAWPQSIKYLSNPWNTSFSLFSLVWVSKTHMLTSLPLTKHF